MLNLPRRGSPIFAAACGEGHDVPHHGGNPFGKGSPNRSGNGYPQSGEHGGGDAVGKMSGQPRRAYGGTLFVSNQSCAYEATLGAMMGNDAGKSRKDRLQKFDPTLHGGEVMSDAAVGREDLDVDAAFWQLLPEVEQLVAQSTGVRHQPRQVHVFVEAS